MKKTLLNRLFQASLLSLIMFLIPNYSYAQADDDNYDIMVGMTFSADLSANDMGTFTYGAVSALVPSNPEGATISVSSNGMLSFNATTPGIYVYGMPVSDGISTETIRLFILAASPLAFANPSAQQQERLAQLEKQRDELMISFGINPLEENNDALAIKAQDDKFENIDFTIYPNPSNGLININNWSDLESVTVVNSVGKIVRPRTLIKGSTLFLEGLASGNYYLILRTMQGETIGSPLQMN